MYFTLIFKTIFMYFFIIFVYRLMGKKEVGQLSIVDLIVSILIAELIALSIQEDNKSILISVIPILVLVGVQIFISYITLKNDKIRNIIDGKPTIIIKNGKLNFTEMSKLRYSLDDLLTQLRLQGVKSIDKVKYAILENNGNLSVFNDNFDYPLPLILDGVIDYSVLKEIKKDYNWLLDLLKRKNIELDDVFYAFYTNNKTFIITKSELF
ncbi:MAG: DUF421 domain-containing protein [Bacilli bacterium]|nr:DUF421 domain-containing protein [Bacilli bacterium]